MPPSARRGSRRNATNVRNTRSAARQQQSPQQQQLPASNQKQSSISDFDSFDPVQIFEEPAIPAPQAANQWPEYLSCSCVTVIDWQTSRFFCDGRLEDHTLVLDIYWNRVHKRAFFRLSASHIELQDKPNLTHVYICIPPPPSVSNNCLSIEDYGKSFAREHEHS